MTVVYLYPAEVAARVKLGQSTLAKLRVSGGGPRFVKLGAAVRYREDDVETWMESRPRATSTSAVSNPTLKGS